MGFTEIDLGSWTQDHPQWQENTSTEMFPLTTDESLMKKKSAAEQQIFLELIFSERRTKPVEEEGDADARRQRGGCWTRRDGGCPLQRCTSSAGSRTSRAGAKTKTVAIAMKPAAGSLVMEEPAAARFAAPWLEQASKQASKQSIACLPGWVAPPQRHILTCSTRSSAASTCSARSTLPIAHACATRHDDRKANFDRPRR